MDDWTQEFFGCHTSRPERRIQEIGVKATIARATIALALMTTSAIGGPFGVDMGAKIESLDVEAIEPKFEFRSVPKPHPSFTSYSGWQAPSTGVCRVLAFSGDFEDDAFGLNVRQAFDRTVDALSEKYGPARPTEVLRSGSIWTEPNDWVMSLKQNERLHAADWENVQSGSEKYSMIQIWIVGLSMNSSMIVLEYRSMDFEKCVAEIEAGQNDSF